MDIVDANAGQNKRQGRKRGRKRPRRPRRNRNRGGRRNRNRGGRRNRQLVKSGETAIDYFDIENDSDIMDNKDFDEIFENIHEDVSDNSDTETVKGESKNIVIKDMEDFIQNTEDISEQILSHI